MVDRKLLVEGGGDTPFEAAIRFFDWTGGINANILLITWASERSDEELSKEFLDWGNQIFKKNQLLMSPSKSLMEQQEQQEQQHEILYNSLNNASGVFFCGGDQNFITELFEKIKGLKDYFITKYYDGIPFGGTSAGAAIMSKTMITGDGNFEVIESASVKTSIGFGIIKNAVIDQHFVKRKRLNRLLSVLTGTTEPYGIGIDEEMAVAIINEVECEVIGSNGTVLLIERQQNNIEVQFMLNILKNNQKFKLEKNI